MKIKYGSFVDFLFKEVLYMYMTRLVQWYNLIRFLFPIWYDVKYVVNDILAIDVDTTILVCSILEA